MSVELPSGRGIRVLVRMSWDWGLNSFYKVEKEQAKKVIGQNWKGILREMEPPQLSTGLEGDLLCDPVIPDLSESVMLIGVANTARILLCNFLAQSKSKKSGSSEFLE